MRLILPALLLAVSAAAPAAARDFVHEPGERRGLEAETIGDIFCLGMLAGDMGALSGLMTADLAALIEEAWAVSDAIAAEAPDEKPPLGDGIPWSGWPDYAPACEASAEPSSDTESFVRIAYGFPDEPEAGYADIVLLRAVPEGAHGETVWRIDDIRYESGPNTLRGALAAVVGH